MSKRKLSSINNENPKKSKKEECNFSLVPNDVTKKIYSFITVKKSFGFRVTCKLFNSLAHENDSKLDSEIKLDYIKHTIKMDLSSQFDRILHKSELIKTLTPSEFLKVVRWIVGKGSVKYLAEILPQNPTLQFDRALFLRATIEAISEYRYEIADFLLTKKEFLSKGNQCDLYDHVVSFKNGSEMGFGLALLIKHGIRYGFDDKKKARIIYSVARRNEIGPMVLIVDTPDFDPLVSLEDNQTLLSTLIKNGNTSLLSVIFARVSISAEVINNEIQNFQGLGIHISIPDSTLELLLTLKHFDPTYNKNAIMKSCIISKNYDYIRKISMHPSFNIDTDGKECLLYAIKYGNDRIIEFLVDKRMVEVSFDNEKPLRKLCETKFSNGVELIINNPRVKLNVLDNEPLLLAVINGNEEVVKKLLCFHSVLKSELRRALLHAILNSRVGIFGMIMNIGLDITEAGVFLFECAILNMSTPICKQIAANFEIIKRLIKKYPKGSEWIDLTQKSDGSSSSKMLRYDYVLIEEHKDYSSNIYYDGFADYFITVFGFNNVRGRSNNVHGELHVDIPEWASKDTDAVMNSFSKWIPIEKSDENLLDMESP
jgi:hypothetical protein